MKLALALARVVVIGVAALVASACRTSVCFGGGSFDGVVSLRSNGLTVEHPGYGSDVYRYDDNPFANCTEIGTILFADGKTDGIIFEHLETLGAVAADQGYFGDFGGLAPLVDTVDGFDQVTSLGSAGPSIREFTGFNNVLVTGDVRAQQVSGFGSLEACGFLETSEPTGLTSLQTVTGMSIGGTLGALDELTLPELRDVDSDVELTTDARAIAFPKLAHVAGDLSVIANPALRTWSGMAQRGKIDGAFTAFENASIENKAFDDWIVLAEIDVGGLIAICRNGSTPVDPRCPGPPLSP